jgi:hypothetical protein
MKKLFALLSIFLVNSINAQNSRLTYLSYSFPEDSLKGFNEAGASKAALNHGFFGLEYKVFMYRAKRDFINKKYGYELNSYKNTEGQKINIVPCVNEDFEASPVGSVTAVAGWTITEGQNTSSCVMASCCASVATGNNSWIRTTPYIAPSPLLTIPNSPLGGTQVIQLNDNVVNMGEVVRLEQTYTVTTSNPILQYAYLGAFDGSGHTCCDNPYLNILLYDCSNNLISAGSTSVVVPGSSCTSTITGLATTSGGVSYFTTWQVKTVNLSAYIGSCVTLQVTVGDCDGWAHYGYCFFDAICDNSTNIQSRDKKKSTIRIYPNPSNGEFKIESDKDEEITITDGTGRVVRTYKLTPSNNNIVITGLSSGIYFVSAENFREKIVVLN